METIKTKRDLNLNNILKILFLHRMAQIIPHIGLYNTKKWTYLNWNALTKVVLLQVSTKHWLVDRLELSFSNKFTEADNAA